MAEGRKRLLAIVFFRFDEIGEYLFKQADKMYLPE
jgi:hypothetical protein